MANNKLDSYDHYVPRTYLKHFSCHEKHVFAYSKKRLLDKPVPINSICGIRGGDIINFSSDKFGLRNLLKDIEKEWNLFLDLCKNKNLIQKINEPVQPEETPFLIKISIFMSYLLNLSPHLMSNRHLSEIIFNMQKHKIYDKDILIDKLLKKGIDLIDKGEMVMSIEQDDYYKYMGMRSLIETAKGIYDKRWILLFNSSDVDFITSDTPAIHFTQDTHEHLLYHAQIYLPLTPKHAILIDPVRSSTIEYKEVTQGDVKKYNKQMIKFASDLVIASSKDPDPKISKLVEKYRSYKPAIVTEIIGNQRFFRVEAINKPDVVI